MAAQKFKMSDGTKGMLRGQVPDAFQRADPSMPARNYANDTEHERQTFMPQKTHADSTGFASQCAGLLTDGVMEQAITDKLNSTYNQRVDAREQAEFDAMEANREVTQAEIEEREDKCHTQDDDDSLEALRARRKEQMKKAQEKKKEYLEKGHGQYDEIQEEEFLKTVTSSYRACVHFYHKNFERCKIADMHLSKIARRCLGTRIVKMDAEKAPFFVSKLHIQTLPTIAMFIDGVLKHKQLGFQGLPNGDEFKTIHLLREMEEAGVIEEDVASDDENI